MTTALEGVRGQPHASAALYPRERPGIHCTGGWVGPRAGLDRCAKSRTLPGFDPRTVQPIACSYTGYATRSTCNIVLGTNPGVGFHVIWYRSSLQKLWSSADWLSYFTDGRHYISTGTVHVWGPIWVKLCIGIHVIKTIPLQAWTGPEDSRMLRLPDVKIIGTWRW